MSIRFRCSCGKSMQAKDEFAGRRYKCPQCDKVVRIPTPKGKESSATPAPVADAKAVPASAEVIAKPAAPPLARPVAAPPLAKPIAVRTPAAVVTMSHPWVDRSLEQVPTPWRPGDEARFQAGIKPMREGMKLWEQAVCLGVILAAGAAVVWLS